MSCTIFYSTTYVPVPSPARHFRSACTGWYTVHYYATDVTISPSYSAHPAYGTPGAPWVIWTKKGRMRYKCELGCGWCCLKYPDRYIQWFCFFVFEYVYTISLILIETDGYLPTWRFFPNLCFTVHFALCSNIVAMIMHSYLHNFQ
jgi:hypothetical protein